MPRCPRDIFVVTGEVSGDHYIARIAECLRKGSDEVRLLGMCGDEGAASGVERLWDGRRLQLMGVAEVVRRLPDVIRVWREVEAYIRKNHPAALILVDSPDFNMPLIRSVRKSGYDGQIFYISPPAVWAWRPRRARILASCRVENLPLFSFEHDFLIKAGCKSRWIGHPLTDDEFSVVNTQKNERMGSKTLPVLADAAGKLIVALLPGSRQSEIDQLYPVLSEVYDILEGRGYFPVFSVAQGLSARARDDLLARVAAEKRRFHDGPGRELMAASDAVAGSSGTATIEALMLRRYMVVLYKMNPLSALIGRLFVKSRHFALPNILGSRDIYPELIQSQAKSLPAADAVTKWLLKDAEQRAPVFLDMDKTAALMGNGGVYDFWTGIIKKES